MERVSSAHPYVSHVGSLVWAAIDAAIAELEENDDLELRTARPYVIGLLCERLTKARLFTRTAESSPESARDALVAVLRGLADGSASQADAQEALTTHYPDAEAESVRQQASFTMIRLHQGAITSEQASEYIRRLIQRLHDRAS
jgi:hypothetical protein